MLVEFLTSAGYCATGTESPGRAIRISEQSKPDVVLVDVCLPEMDGFELCRLIRASDDPPEILIMTGAPVEERYRRLAREHGAVDILQKPMDLDELSARIDQLSTEKQTVRNF